jgi:tRNA pseudouridine55 synthase
VIVAGTLDPMATGLLVLCIERGTKSSMELTAEDKAYSGVLKLGEATPSYDSETPVSERAAWEHVTEEMLQVHHRHAIVS